MIGRGSLALLLLLIATPAFAKSWTVDYQNSKLGFTGIQGSAPFEGLFKTFTATIDFDPAHPETGKITATIDTGSATAGSSDRDEYLPQPDWFDVKKFPQAQFATTSIHATSPDKSGANCYEAAGTLSIKGISKDVTLPFCLKPEGDHMRAQGQLKLMRNDYTVGIGQWANEAYVKHAVDVTIDIAAKAN
jgi:polyisoprenoid-binding protein YceI